MEPSTQADRPHRYLVFFAGTLVLAAFFLAIANLTSGDEYGGRFDLPMVNTVSWLAFLGCAAVGILAAAGVLLRGAEWLWERAQGRSPRRDVSA